MRALSAFATTHPSGESKSLGPKLDKLRDKRQNRSRIFCHLVFFEEPILHNHQSFVSNIYQIYHVSLSQNNEHKSVIECLLRITSVSSVIKSFEYISQILLNVHSSSVVSLQAVPSLSQRTLSAHLAIYASKLSFTGYLYRRILSLNFESDQFLNWIFVKTCLKN